MKQNWALPIVVDTPTGTLARFLVLVADADDPSIAFAGLAAVSGVPQVGRQLSCSAVVVPLSAEVAFQWMRGKAPIAGATGRTYELAAADDMAEVACRVTARHLGQEISSLTPALRVTFAPPVVGEPIGPQSYLQGTGTRLLDASRAFAGEGLRYASSGAGASIDPITGLLSIPTESTVAEAEVTVTAVNSGGEAVTRFPVSVAGPLAVHVAADGDDAASGNPAAPVASLSRAMAMANKGQTILLRRGDVWRETLTVTKDDVVIGAYGAGPLPVISGANSVPGLVRRAAGALELASANFEGGNLSELVATIGTAPVASDDTSLSGRYAMRITSNGTDGRSMGAIGATTPHGGNRERSYHFSFRLARSAVRANSQMRLLRLAASDTQHVYLSLRWNSAREFTTWDLNNHTNKAFLSNTAPIAGVAWDAWNTVELRLATGSEGVVRLIVNGIEQIALAGDYGHANLAAINRLYVGNHAYGAGLASGRYAYFDNLRITGPDTATGVANTWTSSLATNPPQVFIDGDRGRRVGSAGEVDATGRWHWASGILTVFGSAVAAPVVEASLRDVCVDLGARSGVALRDLRIERAGRIGLRADDATRFTVEDLEIAGCYVGGIQASSSTPRTGVRIRRNLVSDCGGTGIGFGGRLSDWIVEENTVERCATLTQGVVGVGDRREAAFEWTAGIKIWGWGGEGWCGAYAIRRNRVRACGPVAWAPGKTGGHGNGIWADEVLRPSARPAIHDNLVSDCWSRGVYLEKTDDHDAFRNLVHGCAKQQYTASLHIDSNQYGYDVTLDQAALVPRRVGGNRVYNNTAVGGWWAFAATCTDAGCSLSASEVRDNIFCGSGGVGAEIYVVGGGSNNGANGSGSVYRRNGWGRDGGGKVWSAGVHSSVSLLEASSGGAVRESVVGDPSFVGAADFTLRPGSPCLGAATSGSNLGHTG